MPATPGTMQIGLDIRKAFDSGIGSYICNLLSASAARAADLDWLLIANSAQKPQLQGVQWLPPRSRILWNEAGKYSLAELYSLPRKVNAQALDIFHAPHWTLPVGLRMPSVVTIHDLIPLRFPQYFPVHKRAYARAAIAHACRSAALILTVSEFSRADIMREFRVAPEGVLAIPNGIDPTFAPAAPGAIDEFCTRYNIERPYLLYAGNIKPHKNLPFLLQAFAEISRDAWPQLVLVGAQSTPEIEQIVRQLSLGDRVIFPGHISQQELICAYSGAGALVMPSLYEGFGLPAVEAMACGTPVIASNAASLPEVVGDAGLLFDPRSREELLAQLERVRDGEMAATLRERGMRRAREFSAEHAATAIISTYRKAMGS